jgi:hypothetical protein
MKFFRLLSLTIILAMLATTKTPVASYSHRIYLPIVCGGESSENNLPTPDPKIDPACLVNRAVSRVMP